MTQIKNGLVNGVYTNTIGGTIIVTQNKIINIDGKTNTGPDQPILNLIHSIPVTTSFTITVTSNKNHTPYWVMAVLREDNYLNQVSINGLSANTPKTITFNADNHGKIIGIQMGCSAGWDNVTAIIDLTVDGKTIF